MRYYQKNKVAWEDKGKTISQFCCNNGRELFSLIQLGAKDGVDFDIAENLQLGQLHSLNDLKQLFEKVS
ncbi:hypothetical protein [Enterocloster citroniae]|uniref:hypothetical protein n=1 Tax=Enterocloster citroniae TaxID=358743 RepID=UPI0009F70A57|nr:hypothetical protein [Enterocloster citroniae]MCB7062323.1 hypothetical protein [Enterocloster citroniae]